MDTQTWIAAADAWARSRSAPVHWLDCRNDLAEPGAGARQFAQGHLPGAIHLPLHGVLAAHPVPDTRLGRHPLPDGRRLREWLVGLGVGADSLLFCFDEAPGMFAARAWWMLRALGFRNVAVVDGGWQALAGQGVDLRRGTAATPVSLGCGSPSHYGGMPWVGHDEVASVLAGAEGLLIDARSRERHEGRHEPIDAIAGRLPGSRNRPFLENFVSGGNPRFKPAGELRAEFEELLGSVSSEAVIHLCGSGISAAVNVLAMNGVGMSGSRLYLPSYSGWIADPERAAHVVSGPIGDA